MYIYVCVCVCACACACACACVCVCVCVDLPLSYTTHLLDPIEQLSLNFTTPIFICKNTVK